ncbi:hypothetical protein G6F24_017083 [Rhizopus arrhizus]|nr:hypothetical protein G6F24_017083 [Rhizopus arrhizus]
MRAAPRVVGRQRGPVTIIAPWQAGHPQLAWRDVSQRLALRHIGAQLQQPLALRWQALGLAQLLIVAGQRDAGLGADARVEALHHGVQCHAPFR